jgi:8-oxo-dGTP pyrophosphatase MutT (NUDIX family)
MDDQTASAVFVPVDRPDVGPFRLGFVWRSPFSTTHAGHVGFPGGKVEPEDDDLRETARRETREETALEPADFSLDAPIDDHHTRATGFAVAPFVGTVNRPDRFVPDSREVTDTFWATVPDLRAAYEMDGDRIRYRVTDGEVWGVTARIVTSLLATRQLE